MQRWLLYPPAPPSVDPDAPSAQWLETVYPSLTGGGQALSKECSIWPGGVCSARGQPGKSAACQQARSCRHAASFHACFRVPECGFSCCDESGRRCAERFWMGLALPLVTFVGWEGAICWGLLYQVCTAENRPSSTKAFYTYALCDKSRLLHVAAVWLHRVQSSDYHTGATLPGNGACTCKIWAEALAMMGVQDKHHHRWCAGDSGLDPVLTLGEQSRGGAPLVEVLPRTGSQQDTPPAT
jgi:hypothetical protein